MAWGVQWRESAKLFKRSSTNTWNWEVCSNSEILTNWLAFQTNCLWRKRESFVLFKWYDCVLGACGPSWEDMQEGGRSVNSLALATATIARDRNTKASSVHYRISTILFYSGVKHDDLIPSPPPSPISLSPSHWLGNLFTSPQIYSVFSNSRWRPDHPMRISTRPAKLHLPCRLKNRYAMRTCLCYLEIQRYVGKGKKATHASRTKDIFV